MQWMGTIDTFIIRRVMYYKSLSKFLIYGSTVVPLNESLFLLYCQNPVIFAINSSQIIQIALKTQQDTSKANIPFSFPYQTSHLLLLPFPASLQNTTSLINPNNYNQPMSQVCEHCKQHEKQFKVLQVQLQFQIKKLNEDMAHQKLTLEMAHQKECKKLIEKIAFTKNQRELENKSWMEKYDAMTQLYEEKLKKAQQRCEQAIVEVKHQMMSKQQVTTQETEIRLKREIVTIKEENEDYKKKLLISKEEEKKYLAKVHEEEIVKITEKHKTEVQSIIEEKQQLEQSITKCEIAQRNHQMIVFELKEEIGAKKGEVQSLKEKIHTLENKIKIYFQPEIHNREKEMNRLKKEHEKVVTKLKEESRVEKDRLIKDFNKNVEQLLQKQLKRCMEYEQKLKDLDQQRQKQLAFYHRSLQELKSAADEKFIPKSQFHQEISTLKVRLTSKEKDIERAKQQIKQCKLEIQNNQEMLNKFFRTSNHNTAPDIFVHTPSNSKKKDYKIKKNRVSLSGSNFLEVGKASTITSMESLDNSKNFESFRML